jgi:hypothetical protein
MSNVTGEQEVDDNHDTDDGSDEDVDDVGPGDNDGVYFSFERSLQYLVQSQQNHTDSASPSRCILYALFVTRSAGRVKLAYILR